jgi:protocatechuate 3,4-dioxygenase beta subunit
MRRNYPGRTRHIHVKVQAPGQPILTTQLFFPGEEGNASDGIYHDSLLMQIAEGAGGNTGRFNFVLDLA